MIELWFLKSSGRLQTVAFYQLKPIYSGQQVQYERQAAQSVCNNRHQMAR